MLLNAGCEERRAPSTDAVGDRRASVEAFETKRPPHRPTPEQQRIERSLLSGNERVAAPVTRRIAAALWVGISLGDGWGCARQEDPDLCERDPAERSGLRK